MALIKAEPFTLTWRQTFGSDTTLVNDELIEMKPFSLRAQNDDGSSVIDESITKAVSEPSILRNVNPVIDVFVCFAARRKTHKHIYYNWGSPEATYLYGVSFKRVGGKGMSLGSFALFEYVQEPGWEAQFRCYER